jgi:uncharacterized membrane protein
MTPPQRTRARRAVALAVVILAGVALDLSSSTVSDKTAVVAFAALGLALYLLVSRGRLLRRERR